MKKILFYFILVCFLNEASAQLNIQPTLPLGGIIQKNTLWNIVVTNTSINTYDCHLELILRDRKSGLEVLTAATGMFQIGPGAKQLNPAFLTPIQYNYIRSDFSERVDDFIPVGNYIACYQLTGLKIIAQECASFDVEPLSPPMLITPADSSRLEVEPTQFIWIPPAPLNLFSNLQYEVLITEILPGQKASEAMQQNLPFYSEPNIYINNLAYKGMGANFEKEKWYAWQIIASDNNNYAAKSEVWVFKISDKIEEKTVAKNIYLLLDDYHKGSYHINDLQLNVKFNSSFKDYKTKVVFKDANGKLVRNYERLISQGENLFNFALDKSFRQDRNYSMSFNDVEGNTHTLIFSIQIK